MPRYKKVSNMAIHAITPMLGVIKVNITEIYIPRWNFFEDVLI